MDIREKLENFENDFAYLLCDGDCQGRCELCPLDVLKEIIR